MVTAALSIAFGYTVWPKNSARFHVLSCTVAINPRNKNQLIANVYIENDGGDAEIAESSAAVVRITGTDQDHDNAIRDVRRLALKAKAARSEIVYSVKAKEKRWFTNHGPVLSDEMMAKLTKGIYSFYFAGYVSIRQSKTPMEYCGFVLGNSLDVILDCPSSATEVP